MKNLHQYRLQNSTKFLFNAEQPNNPDNSKVESIADAIRESGKEEADLMNDIAGVPLTVETESGTLRLKSRPGKGPDNVIDALKSGTVVNLVPGTENIKNLDGHTWYKVAIGEGGQEGWVSSDFLSNDALEASIKKSEAEKTTEEMIDTGKDILNDVIKTVSPVVEKGVNMVTEQAKPLVDMAEKTLDLIGNNLKLQTITNEKEFNALKDNPELVIQAIALEESGEISVHPKNNVLQTKTGQAIQDIKQYLENYTQAKETEVAQGNLDAFLENMGVTNKDQVKALKTKPKESLKNLQALNAIEGALYVNLGTLQTQDKDGNYVNADLTKLTEYKDTVVKAKEVKEKESATKEFSEKTLKLTKGEQAALQELSPADLKQALEKLTTIKNIKIKGRSAIFHTPGGNGLGLTILHGESKKDSKENWIYTGDKVKETTLLNEFLTPKSLDTHIAKITAWNEGMITRAEATKTDKLVEARRKAHEAQREVDRLEGNPEPITMNTTNSPDNNQA